ncbi:MAG: glycoside hydrolase family 127 protein, partial [Thermodesulfobacteriota bacterium]
TGVTKLLNGARRFADYLTTVFGPEGRQGKSGHPELEMAMVELYRTTGERRYLDFADFLLDQLGFAFLSGMEGHAVRAAYACCGGADYYAETGDEAFGQALDRLCGDMVQGKIYITGGIGARHAGEAFGEPYELPNFRAYAETCAAIANIMWNWRMLALTAEARFADLMETTLYNGFLAGVSLDGTRYFYVNPLASWSGAQRQEWYGCTCCPTNVVRMFASLPGYFYSTGAEGIWIHLYDNSRLNWRLEGGQHISVVQESRYPWEGSVQITVSPESPAQFALFLRIPGWCQEAKVTVNGTEVSGEPQPGSYLKLERTWSRGDEVQLDFPMPVTLAKTHPRVRENTGSVAVRRGPIVYCIEGADNPGIPVLDVNLEVDSKSPERMFVHEFRPDLLSGVTVVSARALVPISRLQMPLYQPLEERKSEPMKEVQITLIPYYAWANRALSPMQVWIPWMGK